MKIVIDREKCSGRGECIKACPHNAITIADGKAVLDENKCDSDGICIPACPESAISLEED